MWLKLGNTAPAEEYTNLETKKASRRSVALDDSGEAVTQVVFPEDHDLMEAFTNVCHPGGVWAKHSDDARPAWVMSDVPELAMLVAANFRGSGDPVEIRKPKKGDEPFGLGPASEAERVSKAPGRKPKPVSTAKEGS